MRWDEDDRKRGRKEGRKGGREEGRDGRKRSNYGCVCVRETESDSRIVLHKNCPGNQGTSSYVEIPSYPRQSGHHRENNNAGKDAGGKGPYTLLVGMQISVVAMEISIEGLKKLQVELPQILLWHCWVVTQRAQDRRKIEAPPQPCLATAVHKSQAMKSGEVSIKQ
jgi:hypothetical protein